MLMTVTDMDSVHTQVPGRVDYLEVSHACFRYRRVRLDWLRRRS